MTNSDLELLYWQKLSNSERLRKAQKLAKELPQGFDFIGLKGYQLGNKQNQIALYKYQSSLFSLVPGAEYDTNNPFQPTQEQYKSWQETVAEYELNLDLNQYIAHYTTPLRNFKASPMLVEVNAQEIGIEKVSTEEPKIQAILAEYPDGVEAWDEEHYRVSRQHDGSIEAVRIVETSHSQVSKKISSEGFRLPSLDEWEYLCGAASRSLFRWGDDCLCDRYPTDKSNWNWHRLPNVFGLNIAQNPYNCEIVFEPYTLKGGDGGSLICGGSEFFVAWLTLATAFLNRELSEYVDGRVTNNFARRILSLNQ